jgi:hypothetical protein
MVVVNVLTLYDLPKQAGNDGEADPPVGIKLAMDGGVTCP